MSSVGQDLSYAFRSLRRAKGFTAFAVLILALGISVTTAGYSLLHGIVLRSLPFPEGDRLVILGHRSSAQPEEELLMTPALYTYYGTRSRSLADVALFRYGGTYLSRDDAIDLEVPFAETTPDLAGVLGVRPMAGRWIDEEDVRFGRAVAVLAYDLWVSQYGADPSIVGRTIELTSGSHEVIGVMDEGFTFPGATLLWVPYVVEGTSPFSASEPYGAFRFFGVARVAAGSTDEDVQAELTALLPRVGEVFAGEFADFVVEEARLNPTVEPLESWGTTGVERTLWLLFGASVIVLLIACTNVANLLIVRAAGRRRLIAVRMALGAGRLRLARLSLAEGLVLASAGGALGCVGSLLILAVVERFVPNGVMTRELVARGPEVGLDARILGFAIIVSMTTAVVFSLIPLVRSASVTEELKRGFSGVGVSPSRAHGARVLVAAEVSLTLVLLAAGALMARSLLNLSAIDPGFVPEQKLVFTVASGLRREEAARFHQATIDGLNRLPGVRSAGAVRCLPITDRCHIRNSLYAEHDAEGRRREAGGVVINTVTQGYFEALEVPLLAGRGIERLDHEDRNGAVVISASVARELWPGADPIGERFQSGIEGSGSWLTVVGVVGDVQPHRLTDDPQSARTIYLAMVGEGSTGRHPRSMRYVVLTSGDPTGAVASIRQEIEEAGGGARLTSMLTMDEHVAASMKATRSAATLLLLGALGALLLASAGVYGVVAYAARQRVRELAVRIAFGAGPRRVRGHVFMEAVPATLLGVALGIGVAAVLTQALEPWLVGLRPGDPATMALAATVLVVVVAVATYLPAHQAAKANPADVLRLDA
jgi:predicted permease